MNETYTFSRALHLMRYGGKKMCCVRWPKEMFAVVENDLTLKILDINEFGYTHLSKEQYLEPL